PGAGSAALGRADGAGEHGGAAGGGRRERPPRRGAGPVPVPVAGNAVALTAPPGGAPRGGLCRSAGLMHRFPGTGDAQGHDRPHAGPMPGPPAPAAPPGPGLEPAVSRPQSDDEYGPLDSLDRTLLAQIREMYDSADPVPAELYGRVRFAIDVENADRELAQL